MAKKHVTAILKPTYLKDTASCPMFHTRIESLFHRISLYLMIFNLKKDSFWLIILYGNEIYNYHYKNNLEY
jgi:hypothetical protein